MQDSGDHVSDNNFELLAFKTWLVEQPEYAGCGYVTGANNHREVSTTLWWAGPRSEFQERVLAEAGSRGIKATIIVAKYSRQDLHRAAMLIFDASDDLAAVDFEIARINGTNSELDGLRVVGFDPAHPEPPLDDSTRTAVRAVLQGIGTLVDLIDISDILIEHGPPSMPL